MKKILSSMPLLAISMLLTTLLNAQSTTQTSDLTTISSDGRMTLSKQGASYFANLSLACTNDVYPHFYYERLNSAADLKTPDKLWPSFYGCYDWHSGVHNHWALVKLLKMYPTIPEAAAIKQKLEKSFSADNMLQEVVYLKSHQEDAFEFPYGTSWLLKIADELIRWDNPEAKEWLKNMKPLTDYITIEYINAWPQIQKPTVTGDHFASSLGLSFALDYARSSKNSSLESIVIDASKRFYDSAQNFPLADEPFNYDFMSAGLLITDLMRKIYPADEYETWLKNFSPSLFTLDGVSQVLVIQKLKDHTGYASHFDGFHLNRIWCLNGMLKSLPATALSPGVKNEWIAAQKDMWDYAQESIGKGNYDVDHWLSSFSVFALIGYEN